MKRIVSILLTVTMLTFAASGCAEPNNTQAQGDSSNEQSAQELEKKELDDLNDDSDQQTNGDSSDKYLIWNIGTDPKTFDPTLNDASDGGNVINNLFEGLIRDTKDGYVNAMAESYEISDDGKLYTFKLRSNAKWSDGQPLTAGDFEYAWKRAIDPVTASQSAFMLTTYIKGAMEYYKGEGNIEDVCIKAVDDETLQVELNFPTPYFLSLTSFYTYMPVRKDIVEKYGEGWDKNPETCISNGPFKLSEYQTGSHLLMIKNDEYWDADNVKLSGIKGLMIEEALTSINGYEAGEIHVTDKVPTEEIPRLLSQDPNCTITPKIGTYYVLFNVDAEPVNNVLVRKAMSLAVDRKSICENVTKGGQLPATGFVPPSLSFSDGSCFRELDDNGNLLLEYGIDPYNPQIEEAQKLLADAGYPDGKGFPELEYIYDTSESHKKIAEALQQMWKSSLNIDIKLRNEEWSVFQTTKEQGDFVMARGGWNGDYDDPMTMFELFTSYASNDTRWRWCEQPVLAPDDKTLNPRNKEYDDAIKVAQTTTGKERDEALKEAEEVLMDEMIVIPLYYFTNLQIINESVVTGVSRTTMGNWYFKDAVME